eukprot:1847471-Pleurochrysis_carterae.AAC.4
MPRLQPNPHGRSLHSPPRRSPSPSIVLQPRWQRTEVDDAVAEGVGCAGHGVTPLRAANVPPWSCCGCGTGTHCL